MTNPCCSTSEQIKKLLIRQKLLKNCLISASTKSKVRKQKSTSESAKNY